MALRSEALAVVTTTVGNRADAARLASELVESRLAACVQYHDIRSVYRWKGRVERAGECMLVAKTRKSLARRLVALIRSRHAYDVPEILISPVTGGHAGYARWVMTETELARRVRGNDRTH